MLDIGFGQDSVETRASLDNRVIEADLVWTILYLLGYIAHRFVGAADDARLGDISGATLSEMDQIQSLKSTVPDTSKRFIHELID